MTNITSATVSFENGIKREEYGPVKKAGASITASVAENEDGEAVLARIGELALAQVAALLDAPRPTVAVTEQHSRIIPDEIQDVMDQRKATAEAGEAPPRRGRGRPRKEEAAPAEAAAETTDTAAEASQPATTEPELQADTATDAWDIYPNKDIEITDAEILAATSKRAGELGAREPIVKLIATFATRTEGAPFKVQEIPQAQRKDYLNKLSALTA